MPGSARRDEYVWHTRAGRDDRNRACSIVALMSPSPRSDETSMYSRSFTSRTSARSVEMSIARRLWQPNRLQAE